MLIIICIDLWIVVIIMIPFTDTSDFPSLNNWKELYWQWLSLLNSVLWSVSAFSGWSHQQVSHQRVRYSIGCTVPSCAEQMNYCFFSSLILHLVPSQSIQGPVSIYPKDVFEMVADRNAASSLAESSQRRLCLLKHSPGSGNTISLAHYGQHV